jgi:hypothetical protein
MHQLVKIFDGTYATGSPIKLEGVIQLFNCFYIKEQDLKEAEIKYKEQQKTNGSKTQTQTEGFTFQEGHYFKNKPVYFGWGNSGKTGFVKNTAKDTFTNYAPIHAMLYDTQFEKNPFYHPRYVHLKHANIEQVKQHAVRFFDVVKKTL